MRHVEWNPRDLTREEVESLVLIPEKKLVIGYNMTCGDNVIYDNALGPRGGLLWGDQEVMPSEDQQFEMLSEFSEEEVVDSLMSTQIAIVDDAPKKEMKTAEERYEDARQVGVVNVDAPIATATREVVEIAPAKEAKQDDEVFRAVEQMPIYPGGDAALYKAINDNLVYPSLAAENNIQGQVVVQFVIQKDGSIGKVVVARSVDPELDREAIRVVKKLGKFTPGRNNGVPVAVWYTLPIRFKLASM
ncbi:MAG: energy transducer TonB [Muribaculaceae bacterium]|nr:energy transducer TonB [Muribaculaceae bacterium]MDE6321273.1 energy transducer TonB [Muribaculaceae bacterium]